MIDDVSIVDHGFLDSKHDLAIELPARPDALFFKDVRRGVLKATACGTCGNVELSVDNARELWEIYRKQKDA